ncbi:hypothetical protein ACFL1N_04535 [Thermodesulfobacteriota bacterium]
MAGSKYGKHIKSGILITDVEHYTGKSIVAHKGELDAECSLGYHCISKPMSFDIPHSHNFHEMLCFIGGNPEDITGLGAEIEFTMGGGDNRETHRITESSVVSIPAGLVHCPIVFTRVKKPIIFLEISLSRTWNPEDFDMDNN